MKLAKFFIVFTFLLAFAVCVSAQTSKNKQIKLSTKDKRGIIQQVFDDGFEKLMKSSAFNQCLTPLVEKENLIFLMTEEDKTLFPQKINEYRFMFMTYSQIDEEVKKNNGERYLKFDGFQINNSKVGVLLNRYVDEIYHFENSSKYTRWISGEGYVYEFEEINRKWQMSSSKKTITSS